MCSNRVYRRLRPVVMYLGEYSLGFDLPMIHDPESCALIRRSVAMAAEYDELSTNRAE